MSSENPLDPIWESYQVICDCLKIAQRGISEKNERLLNRTNFLANPEDQSINQVKNSRTDANDYVILSLWAGFERIIMEYLQIQGRRILSSPPSAFNQKIHEQVEREIEYWKIDDILNIFKMVIDPDIIGQAKQIKQYRDWVAHRNPSKGTPPNITPQKAYEIISKILKKLEEHPDFGTI
ncbi:MAG: hypothetical protein U9N77_11220 [Thermodesulfobacteriota bacterium]|nr:hypothetical protein [Thermodesulfobacteriota bacterium]